MHWQPLSVCKTLLIIKVQLSTSYNLLKLSGYLLGRDSVGERFFRNAAKEMGKNRISWKIIKKIVLHEILTGRAPDGKR